jgi:acetyltransferase-like isoleucine patch superfamily enzyme
MQIKKYVPEFIKKYLKQKQMKKRFPRSEIHSIIIHDNINLGEHCFINTDVLLCSGVNLGDFSYINSGTRVWGGTQIGKFCSISYNCQIGLPDHPTNYISSHPATYGAYHQANLFDFGFEEKEGPIIGNDVWIGVNAVILRGITVHDGAIVAAGAIVISDVPAYSIVGGVPAKVIKYRFDDEKIAFLKKLKWWDLSAEELQKHKKLFSSKDKWIADVHLRGVNSGQPGRRNVP